MALAFMKTAGVETVEALWDIPSEKMVDLQAKVTGGARSSGPGLRYVPVYETPSLPLRPIDAISNGALRRGAPNCGKQPG